MINQAILTGHLGGEPEFRQVGETDLATFSVAVNVYRGRNKEDDTMWVRANLWGGMSRWAKGLETGDRVTIQGQLREDRWEADNGETRTQVVVDVRGIHTPKRDTTSGERANRRSRSNGGQKKSRKKKAPF